MASRTWRISPTVEIIGSRMRSGPRRRAQHRRELRVEELAILQRQADRAQPSAGFATPRPCRRASGQSCRRRYRACATSPSGRPCPAPGRAKRAYCSSSPGRSSRFMKRNSVRNEPEPHAPLAERLIEFDRQFEIGVERISTPSRVTRQPAQSLQIAALAREGVAPRFVARSSSAYGSRITRPRCRRSPPDRRSGPARADRQRRAPPAGRGARHDRGVAFGAAETVAKAGDRRGSISAVSAGRQFLGEDHGALGQTWDTRHRAS